MKIGASEGDRPHAGLQHKGATPITSQELRMHRISDHKWVPSSFLDAALRSKSLACALHPDNMCRRTFSTLASLFSLAHCLVSETVSDL